MNNPLKPVPSPKIQDEIQLDSALGRKILHLDALRDTLECDFLRIRKISVHSDIIRIYALHDEHRALGEMMNNSGASNLYLSDSDIASITLSALLTIEHLSLAGIYLSTICRDNIFYKPGSAPFIGCFEPLLMMKSEDRDCSIVPAIWSLAETLYEVTTSSTLDPVTKSTICEDDTLELPCGAQVTLLIRQLLKYTGSELIASLQDFVMFTFSRIESEPVAADHNNLYDKLGFFQAAETGNLAALQQLKTKFAGSLDTDGNTALMIAAKRLSLNAVKILAPLEAGTKHPITGNTALHYAMIGKGFQDTTSNISGPEPFSAFDQFILIQIVRTLGPYEGCIPNAAGELPITLGISNSFPDSIIRLLLTYSGHDLSIPDNLIASAKSGNIIGTYLHLDESRRVDSLGNTALVYAIASKNIACIKLLTNEKDICIFSGATPWQLAYDSGLTSILSLLEQDPVIDIHGNTQLHNAVMAGDLVQVRSFLSLSRRKNNDGYTALMLAVALECGDIVCLLRSYEAGEWDNNGFTALHQSCLYGRTTIALLLVDYEKSILTTIPVINPVAAKFNNVDIDPKLLKGNLSAAELAFYVGNLDLSKGLMLPEHTVTSSPNNQGRTDLMNAALANDSFKTFCYLGQATMIDNDGFTALMHASASGHKECALLLAVLEAEVTVTINNRCVSALDIAVLNGSFEVAEAIAEYELIVPNSASYPSDMTQLMIAAAERRPGLVWLYIDQVNARDAKGWTALMYATKSGDIECVKLLLMERALVADDGVTAWYLAYKMSNEVLQEMLRPSYEANDKGETPLHEYVLYIHLLSSEQHEVKLPTYLHCYGAFNREGCTALMLAAKYGLTDICKELLELESGLTKIYDDGTQPNCASLFALEAGHIELFKLLSTFELDLLLAQGFTMLMISAISGDTSSVIQYLSDSGSKTNVGWTALMYAAKYKYAQVVALLSPLEAGLINIKGQLATDIALQNKFMEGANIILRYEFQKYSNGLLALTFLDSVITMPSSYALNLLTALLYPIEESSEESMENIRRLMYKHVNPNISGKIIGQLEESAAALHEYIRLPAFEDEQGNTQLHVAAAQGNLEVIQACIHLVRRKNKQGQTALMVATEFRNQQAIALLADLEGGLVDESGKLAFDYALDDGEYELVQILAKCEEESKRASAQGFTPLMMSVIQRDINLLKENICFCQAIYRRKYTALGLAIRQGNISFVEILKMESTIEAEGIMPWRLAVNLGFTEIASLIKPSIRFENGQTALHRAALAGDEEAVESLLYENGAQDRTGRTALILAIENRNTSIAKILIPYEFNIPFAGKWSNGDLTLDSPSSLLIATYMQNEELCREILRQGRGRLAQVQDKNGITPLMLSAKIGCANLIDMYLPTQLGMADRSGNTSLMWAVKSSQSTIVKLLLEEAGRLNTVGECALSLAIERRDIESIVILIDREVRLLTVEFILSVHDAGIRALLPKLEDMSPNDSSLRTKSRINSVGIKLSGRRSASTSMIQKPKISSYAPSPTIMSSVSTLAIKEPRKTILAHPLTPSFIFAKG